LSVASTVQDVGGREHTFTVQRVEQTDKDALAVTEIWKPDH
jgi:hypothetical protein